VGNLKGHYVLSMKLLPALFGARLPVFSAAHCAKITKLALRGSNMAIFTLHSPGKKTAVHDVAPEITSVE